MGYRSAVTGVVFRLDTLAPQSALSASHSDRWSRSGSPFEASIFSDSRTVSIEAAYHIKPQHHDK